MYILNLVVLSMVGIVIQFFLLAGNSKNFLKKVDKRTGRPYSAVITGKAVSSR